MLNQPKQFHPESIESGRRKSRAPSRELRRSESRIRSTQEEVQTLDVDKELGIDMTEEELMKAMHDDAEFYRMMREAVEAKQQREKEQKSVKDHRDDYKSLPPLFGQKRSAAAETRE
eukprot:CAMPEP_0197256238 /NCGR_PEP_ID=MMETSP1429-20130617/74724_1 /TAXON_ID=49237 /ORGANISM="Chaetoceros  sp., Strain UNC1202" /LENGTH=116 /DNA_ID=CAMNT_0042719751 /DNA_START=294 /DNA_END=644 /DNA_ORIENTATION=-